MTYVLTHFKNNVVVTGASKNLVATVFGWNQSLIAAMYFYNNNNNDNNDDNNNNNNNNNNNYNNNKAETQKRMNALVQQDLYDKNLIKAINRTVIPVAGYVMNICTFTKQKLDELDKAIKKILRDNKMHGRQASDEWLYMRREYGERGLKHMKDLYKETKVRVACHMTHSESAWIKTVWRREFQKEGKSIKSEQKMH